MTKCEICGKEIKQEFTYVDEFGVTRAIHGLCANEKCVELYEERYGDCEPAYDVEEVWERQQDDLWEASVVF